MTDDELSQLQLIEMFRDIVRTYDQYYDSEMWSDDEARLHKLLQADVRRYFDKFDEVDEREEPEDPLYKERRRSKYDDGSGHDLLYRAVFAGGEQAGYRGGHPCGPLPFYRHMDEQLIERKKKRQDAEFAEAKAKFDAEFGTGEDKAVPQPASTPAAPPAGGRGAGEPSAGRLGDAGGGQPDDTRGG